MKRVLIILLHDDIRYVSDRSLRDLLKNLGKITRRVQLKEIETLLQSSELSERECQSLLDLVKNESQSAPVYYLNKIRKGSLEASFFIGAAFLGALVGKLVDRVVLDVSTKNAFYRHLIRHLEEDRQVTLAAKLEQEIEGENLGGRFFVSDVKISETKQRVIIHVELETPMEFEDRLPEEVDESRVRLLLEQRLRETAAKAPKAKGSGKTRKRS